jgi:GNAT superfamily N-acetyltransferase
MSAAYSVRRGGADDLHEILGLLDAAVEWLVARGAEGQWGSDPFSTNASMVRHLSQIISAGELRIARDQSERVVGGYVLGLRPAYAPVIRGAERYIEAMVTARDLAGRGIGTLLVDDAIDRARLADARAVRTDCWAEAPRLIRWYEECGFERGDRVWVGAWPAQMLHMAL